MIECFNDVRSNHRMFKKQYNTVQGGRLFCMHNCNGLKGLEWLL